MNTKTISIIALLIIVVAGGSYLYMTHKNEALEPADTVTAIDTTAPSNDTTTTVTTTSTDTAPKAVTITYTDSGFSPKTVTVAPGTKVTWVNQSSERMWVASNNHPSHTLYNSTSLMQHCAQGAPNASDVFDQCAGTGNGSSFSFTFAKEGTWAFHNHAAASDQGTVVVKAP